MIKLLPILGIACFTAAVPPTTLETTEPTPKETVVRAGFRVVVDPVTGEIVNNPTDAELEQLSRLPEGVAVERRRSSWELREFFVPTGGRGVFLDGWADHSLTVEVTADGKIRTVCSQGDPHSKTTAAPEANDR